MGRYTTVQTFTDSDAKGAISYSAASGNSNNKSSHYGPGGGSDATPSTISNNSRSGGSDRHSEPKLAVNRVENVSGSTAGAGSGDFHMYRASRRREMDRVERMERAFEAQKTQEAFERTRLASMTEFEARAHKRAEKRRRRKERTKMRAVVDGSRDVSDSDSETQLTAPAAKKSKTSAVGGASAAVGVTNETAALPETPGGVPEIANDGSFLARMLAEQAAKQATTQSKKKAKKKIDERDESDESE